MDYQEALENLKQAKKKHLRAEKKLSSKKAGLAELRNTVPELHEALTDAMANREIGDATEEDVSEARRKWENGKEEIEELKTEISAAEKTLPLLQKKIDEAREEFKEPAYEHFQEKAQPVIEQHIEAIEQMQQANNTLCDLWKEIDDHGLSPGNYLPARLEMKYLKPKHRKQLPVDRYIKEAEQVND